MKTKQDLISLVHADSDINKNTIGRVVQDFVEVLRAELEAGNTVRIQEIGTFKTAIRKAHTGRNPSTGEAIEIREKRVPQLKFNRAISMKLNKE